MQNFSPLHTHGSHPIHLANLKKKKKKHWFGSMEQPFVPMNVKKKKPLRAMRLLALNCFEELP
jgi:hypothetical protein